jgi:hypothetical protein
MGFRQSATDACLFINDEKKMYLLLYVDDLLLLNKTTEDMKWFFAELGKHVLLKHTGSLTAGTTLKFLGRQLTHRGDNILVQPLAHYIEELLQMYNLDNCRPATTTGNSQLKPTVEDEEPLSPEEHSKYRTAVGKLQWLTGIRPDLNYATKELARGLHCPNVGHKTQLKHLLRYIAGTADTGLMLRPTYTMSTEAKTVDLHVYCDSDWAGCKTTRKSTTGVVTQLLGCTIQHCSRTQATIALSSTESETYAICTGLAEALYIKQLLMDTRMFTEVHIHLHTDSTGAKATATRQGLAPKTKHMQLRYLWIQNCFTTGLAKLHKIGTKENMPDILTKYVTAEILRYLGAKVGLVTTTVVIGFCSDYYLTDATDDNNNSMKPTIEHCKRSTVHCPNAPNSKESPMPHAEAKQLPSDETVARNKLSRAQHCPNSPKHCPVAMATAHGFTLLGDLTAAQTGSPELKFTGLGLKTDKAPTSPTAATSAAATTVETEPFVHFTNGCYTARKGCYHNDENCWALTKATTGVASGYKRDAKLRNLVACKICTAPHEKKVLKEELAASTTDLTKDCGNYMFSVTAETDIHSAVLSSMDTAEEANCFRHMELVYQKDCKTETFVGKTGLLWTVGEVPELKYLITQGLYNGESMQWGNWVLWTDPLSALNHWLMRALQGTNAWAERKNCEKHCLIGVRLDCTKLVNDFICKETGTFNRLHWSHSITGKSELRLTPSERDCIIAFELKKNPTAYMADTKHWVRHCQLSWDTTGSKPGWAYCVDKDSWSTAEDLKATETSPASTAKLMPDWLSRSITAVKNALMGRD